MKQYSNPNMDYSLTIFKSIFDNRTHRSMVLPSWNKFESLLYSLSKEAGYKPKKDERCDGSPLITPAIFNENGLRRNDNVQYWGGWAALDVDQYDGTFEDAIKVFKDVKYICYSSASSTIDHPKFRMVLPLSQTVKAEQIKHLWYALNKEFNSLGDPQTKDLSRMYYVPAVYPNAHNFIFSNNDTPVIDTYDIMNKHPYVSKINSTSLADNLPAEMKKQLLQYRLGKLTNKSYQWSSYIDCPFVNKNMVNEYRSIHGGGWYHKMYQIMLNISSNAMSRGYPITAQEVATLCKQIDNDTGGWYKNRNMETESCRAILFASQNL